MTTPAHLPLNEEQRLAALRRYAILDTPAEDSFDHIVNLAARQFDVPVALISLVDQDRQWFKAACGMDVKETKRDIAFCAHAILGDDVFVVPDATQDARFADNPLVTDGLKIRFYAGAPLVSAGGYKLGTLCLIDDKARKDFSERDKALLKDLASVVVDQIEMRHAVCNAVTEVEGRIEAQERRAAVEHQLGLFFDNTPIAVAMFDQDIRYLGASKSWCDVFNLDGKNIVGHSKYDLYPLVPDEWREQDIRCLSGESFKVEEDRLPIPGGSFHWVRRQVQPWKNQSGAIGGIIVFIETIDDRKTVELELAQSQRFVKAVLDNIQDGIVACDAEGRLTLFNEATRRFHGVDSRPTPPERWAEKYNLYEPDGKTPLAMERVPLYRALSGEVVESQEMVIAPHQGVKRKLVASGTAMYDEQGKKLGAVATMHDVTNERDANEKWREANARYRAIFDHTFQFCGLLDLDGRVLEANETALKFGGFSRDVVIGKTLWSTPWWPEDGTIQKQLKDAIAQACGGEFVRYEVEVYGEGKTLTPIDFSVKPVTNDAGAVTHLIAEGRDISELWEKNEALRRNQAELELILNNVPILIFYKDDKNRILRLNETAAQSLNKTVAEVEGKSTYDLYPEYAAKYHKDDLEVINSGEPKLGIIETYIGIDGETRWVRTDKVPYIDPESGNRYVFVAATDITAEKSAQEALNESRERYRFLYNNTPVMLHSVDRDGRILSVSDFWLEKLGYARNEVIGCQLTDFLSEDFVRRDNEAFSPEFWRTGVCKDIEYQFVTKSGDIIDVLLSAVAEYDDEGEIVRSMGVLTDITERKIVERQFVQAQKMESVGQLTGGLAHDFNNLLGVVIGNLQLVERSLENDAKALKRISAAVKAAEKGAELNRRLLAFSRRQKLESEVIDAKPLIETMSDLLQRTLGEEIDLECRLDPDMPKLETDPAQLESALLNLAVNARDAMPSGGRLTIEGKVVHLDQHYAAREEDVKSGDYVMLAVTDNGVGIPEDKIEKVFDPFFTTKEFGGGSGLGLSMVYGFMKQTGGHARIYSEVGRGTTVRLYLPVAQTIEPEQSSARTVSHEVGGNERILVVEDQEEVREVAVALLEDLGYSVVQAESAKEGLDLLQADSDVDLLFTDIVMPGGIDGTQLARAARALRPSLPIVFTTGYAEAAVLRKGEIKAAENLVTKPYRRADLAVKVRQALDAPPAREAPDAACAS